jgi:hypothetical protein
MRRMKCFFKVHAPAHVSELKNEHVMIGSAYGVAAASFHHWIGSAVVAIAYFSAAYLGTRENAKSQDQS